MLWLEIREPICKSTAGPLPLKDMVEKELGCWFDDVDDARIIGNGFAYTSAVNLYIRINEKGLFEKAVLSCHNGNYRLDWYEDLKNSNKTDDS